MPIPREVPPTSGLPLEWRDLFGASGGADLESALAAFLDVRSIGLTSSGTAALIVTLETLRRRSERRVVVVPAYTCPLVPIAVARAGCEVRLCDLRAGGLDLDPDSVAAACRDDTLAIVPTHLAGIPADLAPVVEAARRSGAAVLEDAAQALGATWHGRPVGTLGDVGFYSLSRGKGLTLYEGGFWVTSDERLAAGLRATSDRLLPRRAGIEIRRAIELLGYGLFYNPIGLTFVYGMPLRRALARGDLLAAVGDLERSTIPLHRVGRWRRAVGTAALRRLRHAIVANAERGRARARELERIPGVSVVGELADTAGTWPFLMVIVGSRETRDRVLARLWTSGLGVTRLFLHELGGYDYLGGVVPGTPTPNARALAERSFTISNSEYLSEAGFRKIYETVAASVS